MFFEECFKQALSGNIIGQHKTSKFCFRVKKQEVTKAVIESEEEKIYKQGVMGYHYFFSFIKSEDIIMQTPTQQIEELKKVLTERDFPICR